MTHVTVTVADLSKGIMDDFKIILYFSWSLRSESKLFNLHKNVDLRGDQECFLLSSFCASRLLLDVEATIQVVQSDRVSLELGWLTMKL